jgi:hypothetical protein
MIDSENQLVIDKIVYEIENYETMNIVVKELVRMMILGQSKRRRTLFRRRKFDVLIESI